MKSLIANTYMAINHQLKCHDSDSPVHNPEEHVFAKPNSEHLSHPILKCPRRLSWFCFYCAKVKYVRYERCLIK